MKLVNTSDELVRRAVYKAFSGRCFYSGVELNAEFQVDHFIPKAKGGIDATDNLVLCRPDLNGLKNDTCDESNVNYAPTQYLLQTVFGPKIDRYLKSYREDKHTDIAKNRTTKLQTEYENILNTWKTATKTLYLLNSHIDSIEPIGGTGRFSPRFRLQIRHCYAEDSLKVFCDLYMKTSKIYGYKLGMYFVESVGFSENIIELVISSVLCEYYVELFEKTVEHYDSDKNLIDAKNELVKSFRIMSCARWGSRIAYNGPLKI